MPAALIHVVAAPDSKTYFNTLDRIKGNKHVYVFGHSSTLYLQFGFDNVDLGTDPQHLLDTRVQSLCHFGCMFAAFDSSQIAVLQGAMKEDGSFLYSGHFDLSTRSDDNIDESNPNKMQVIQVSPQTIDTLALDEMEQKIQGSNILEYILINR